MINLTKENKQSLIFLIPAAVLFVLSLFSGIRFWLRIVFAVVSLIFSLLDGFVSIRKDISSGHFTSPCVLISLASVLGLISGRFCASAAALLVFRICVILLDRRLERTRDIIGTRLSMSGIEEHCAGFDPSPVISGKLYNFLNSGLSYILIAVAVVTLILTPVLSDNGIADGLYRAAVILSAASAACLFSAYPLSDYASVAAAAENGIVFASGAVEKLLSAAAVCPSQSKPVLFGGAAVVNASDDLLTAESVILLASHAFRAASDGDSKTSALADILCTAYGGNINLSAVSDARCLEGMGVIAKIHGMTVLAGSSELMKHGGLPVAGFEDLDRCIHVAVNGRYAGCIVLSPDAMSDEDFLDELNVLGLRLISRPGDRDGEECVLAFSCDGLAPEGLLDGDIYAAECGYAFKNSIKAPDVRVSCLGTRAVHRVLRLTYNALAVRTGTFAIAAAVKLIVLLLGIFGFIPLWIAVLAQVAALYVCYVFVLHALDFTVD